MLLSALIFFIFAFPNELHPWLQVSSAIPGLLEFYDLALVICFIWGWVMLSEGFTGRD